MRKKFELLIQINTSIETGKIPNLDDIFHADYLYLKDNTLVNRDEHIKFMRKEFIRKISGLNIGLNDGKDSGQTIFHCHIHLIPRRKNDVTSPRGGVRGVIPDKQSY